MNTSTDPQLITFVLPTTFKASAESLLTGVDLEALQALLAGNPLKGDISSKFPGAYEIKISKCVVYYLISEDLATIFFAHIEEINNAGPITKKQQDDVNGVLKKLIAGGAFFLIKRSVKIVWDYIKDNFN